MSQQVTSQNAVYMPYSAICVCGEPYYKHIQPKDMTLAHPFKAKGK